MKLSRRRLLKTAAAAGGVLASGRWPAGLATGRDLGAQAGPAPAPGVGPAAGPSRVAVIRTDDHRDGVLRAVRLLGVPPVRDRSVVIKPNLNSSHPFPASTHLDTIRTLIEVCR